MYIFEFWTLPVNVPMYLVHWSQLATKETKDPQRQLVSPVLEAAWCALSARPSATARRSDGRLDNRAIVCAARLSTRARGLLEVGAVDHFHTTR